MAVRDSTRDHVAAVQIGVWHTDGHWAPPHDAHAWHLPDVRHVPHARSAGHGTGDAQLMERSPGGDLVAGEREGVAEIDGTTGEVTGDATRDDRGIGRERAKPGRLR